jgi:WD40 repeat protein
MSRIGPLSLLWLVLSLSGVSGREPAAKAKPARTDLYGDPLPQGAVARLGTLRFRHPEEVCALAFSPDGKVLASASAHVVILWERTTERELGRYKVKPLRVLALAYNRGGTLLALASPAGDPRDQRDKKAYLVDVVSGKTLRSLPNSEGVVSWGAFAADGSRLVTGSPAVCVWDAGTGKEIRRLGTPEDSLGCLALSPDGALVATASAGVVSLRDARTGKEARQVRGLEGARVFCTAFSPDGSALACGGERGRLNGALGLWDTATGKPQHALRLGPVFATATAFSSDGNLLAVGRHDGTICLWQKARGSFAPVAGPSHAIYALTFTADGISVMTAGMEGRLRHWNPHSGKSLRDVRASPGAEVGVFSADGRTLAAYEEDGIQLWDTATGKLLCRLEERGNGSCFLALSPDGSTLATAPLPRRAFSYPESFSVWDVRTGKRLYTRSVRNSAIALSFSPDGEILAVGGNEGSLSLWDTSTGERIREAGPREPPGLMLTSGLAFSPDGTTLLVAYFGRSPSLWEVPSCREIRWPLGAEEGEVHNYCSAFSPDGVFAAAGGRTGVWVWEAATGRKVAHFEGHTEHVLRLAFSPNGTRLVSGSGDHSALVWEVPTLPRRPAEKLAPAALPKLWTQLASTDATDAHRALLTLFAAPEQSVPFLKERLRPVPATASPERLQRLFADLGSERFAVRQEATRELEKLGEQAGPALRKLLEGKPPLEVSRRAERLLEQLRRERFAPSPERLRQTRAIRVLERAATPEARRLLIELSRGAPGAHQTEAARAALDRLDRRP